MTVPDLWAPLRQALIRVFTDARTLAVVWLSIVICVIWVPEPWVFRSLIVVAFFALLGVWAQLAEPTPYQKEEENK